MTTPVRGVAYRRRVALFLWLTCALLSPLAVASAQPEARTPRVGFLWIGAASPPSPLVQSFQRGLRDLGWIDGQNVIVDYRYAEGKAERFEALAGELVQLPVDVIVAPPAPATFAAKKATTTIPIVITIGADPVALELVDTLDQPGRNITGLHEITPELTLERVALLREIVPGLTSVAVLQQPGTIREAVLRQTRSDVIDKAIKTWGISAMFIEAQAAADLDAAFEEIVQRHCEGLIVMVSPTFNAEAKRIVSLAAKHRLPAIYEWRTFVAAGGAISYGADLNDIYRRAAGYVDKILKGAKPSDLPIEQPIKIELIVDLNHAKDFGMTIPAALLQRADQVLR